MFQLFQRLFDLCESVMAVEMETVAPNSESGSFVVTILNGKKYRIDVSEITE